MMSNLHTLDLLRLLQFYDTVVINVGYKVPHSRLSRSNNYISIPVNADLFYRLNVWIIYDANTNRLEFSDRLKTIPNLWIIRLKQDLRNKTINISEFFSDYEE